MTFLFVVVLSSWLTVAPQVRQGMLPGDWAMATGKPVMEAPKFLWCRLESLDDLNARYYSKVFLSELHVGEAARKFSEYAKGRLGIKLAILEQCWAAGRRSDAEEALNKDAAFYRGLDRRIVFTEWEP